MPIGSCAIRLRTLLVLIVHCRRDVRLGEAFGGLRSIRKIHVLLHILAPQHVCCYFFISQDKCSLTIVLDSLGACASPPNAAVSVGVQDKQSYIQSHSFRHISELKAYKTTDNKVKQVRQ